MPQELSAAVAAEVRRLMAEHDVTAYALFKATGIPQSSLSRKLKGPGLFDFDDVQKMAPVLGTTAADIVRAAEQASITIE